MRLKRRVLSFVRNLVMSDGSAFHTHGPAMDKAVSYMKPGT